MSPLRTYVRQKARTRLRLTHATSSRKALRTAGITLLASVLIAACGGGGKSTGTSTSTSLSTPQTSTTQTSTTTVTAVTGTVVSPGLVQATAGGVRATLRAGTHKPRVNAAWPIHFRVIEGNAPAKARVSYEYLFNGSVVAKRSHYTFVGSFSDVFRWPPNSVGYPLTFRAVIVAGGRTLYLDYPVKVTP